MNGPFADRNRDPRMEFARLPDNDCSFVAHDSQMGQGSHQLPPIRRINNHLPPRHKRAPSPVVQPSQIPAKPHFSCHGKALHSKVSDAGSVMNLSVSGSDSEYSYSDDDSDDQTAYTYAEDEPAANLNCMNTLFFPGAKDQGTNDMGIIRCHRVGPSSAELQLNITLPSQYMNHLNGPSGENVAGIMSSLDGVCKVPSLNRKCDMNYSPSQYDPALVEEAVVEIDPYKQFRERIAPQFYASLITELSGDEEDEEEESMDHPDQDDVVLNKDDSHIFGYLDAQRQAAEQMQMAMYNEIVLQQGLADPMMIRSPPSQIFLPEEGSMTPTSMTPCGEVDDAQTETGIELSIDGSEEVFSRPEEQQDGSLNRHLRESVDAGMTLTKLTDLIESDRSIVTETTSTPPSSPSFESARVGSVVVDQAPSMDESTKAAERTDKSERSLEYAISDEKSDSNVKSASMSVASSPSDVCVSDLRTTNGGATTAAKTAEPTDQFENVDKVVSRMAWQNVPSVEEKLVMQSVAIDPVRPALEAFPSFDEPGQIQMKGMRNKILNSVPERENSAHVLVLEPSREPADRTEPSSSSSYCQCDDAPEDEIKHNISTVSREDRDGKSLQHPASALFECPGDEDDVPADERGSFLSNEENRSKYLPLINPSRTAGTDSFASYSSPPKEDPDHLAKKLANKNDLPVNELKAIKRRSKNRSILEESSKTNIRESRRRRARELRKQRIRTFDPVRPALAAAALITMFDQATRPQSRLCENSNRGGIDEVPDLEDLEFHSCEEGVSSHMGSENFF